MARRDHVGPLERVLVNLVANARDALGATGTIVVRTADVTLLDDPAPDGALPTPPLPAAGTSAST